MMAWPSAFQRLSTQHYTRVLTALFALVITPIPALAATPVVAHTVEREQVADRIEALGTLKANESVALTANAPDIITEVLFEDGQQVAQGAVLIQMASDEEQAALREARHKMEEAQAQLERVRAVSKRGGASQSLVDEREREFNVAQAQLAAIASQLRDRQVVAPFSGTVGLRNVSPGAYLTPGDVITTLTDDTTMKLDFTLPALWLNSVQKGTAIQATSRAWPDDVFTGEVSAINNLIDPVSRSVTVRALLPNPDKKLKPGLLMEIELLTRPREAIVIPEAAITPEGDQHFVHLVRPQEDMLTAEKKAVTIGARWPGKVEILSGLAAGEQVITHGADKLRPGAPISLLDRPPTQP